MKRESEITSSVELNGDVERRKNWELKLVKPIHQPNVNLNVGINTNNHKLPQQLGAGGDAVTNKPQVAEEKRQPILLKRSAPLPLRPTVDTPGSPDSGVRESKVVSRVTTLTQRVQENADSPVRLGGEALSERMDSLSQVAYYGTGLTSVVRREDFEKPPFR